MAEIESHSEKATEENSINSKGESCNRQVWWQNQDERWRNQKLDFDKRISVGNATTLQKNKTAGFLIKQVKSEH